ncbi:MAG: polymer-forming cytoskeletal protein [Gammaproteobacteria bacterium]|nr:polymer-forming cytoskeletal protein [Gammaproteobacteria bacterium]
MFTKTKKSGGERESSSLTESSVIGPTLQFIGGRLSSGEDLIIEGVVEGTIDHQSHHLRIGSNGKVKADIHAGVIIVEGKLEGNMKGDEAVEICSTARVIGDIIAPRVSIADGATFEGHIKTSQESLTPDLSGVDQSDPLTDFAGHLGVYARRRAASKKNDG